MLRTSQLAAYLRQRLSDTSIINGSIEKDKPQSIGVYGRQGVPPVVAVGGKENSSYNILPISILVHWTENQELCDEKAEEIYDLFFMMTNTLIGSSNVIGVAMKTSSPVNVGRDEKNICESVIEMDIYFER